MKDLANVTPAKAGDTINFSLRFVNFDNEPRWFGSLLDALEAAKAGGFESVVEVAGRRVASYSPLAGVALYSPDGVKLCVGWNAL